jgi:hypothetical protein
MVKKIQCRVIASAVLGDINISNNEILTKDNPIINNFPRLFRFEMLTYTNRSGTAKVNHDDCPIGKFVDYYF